MENQNESISIDILSTHQNDVHICNYLKILQKDLDSFSGNQKHLFKLN